MNKLTSILLVFFLASAALYGQKKINCKSGQILELTSQGYLISTNTSALINQKSDRDSLWLENYKELLIQEMNNRLEFVQKENEITLLHYEKSIKKEEAKEIESKIATIKRDMQQLDKAYSTIQLQFKKLESAKKGSPITKTSALEQESKVTVETKEEVISKTEEITTTLPREEIPSPTTEPVANKQEAAKLKPMLQAKKTDNCDILFKGRSEKNGKKQVVLRKDAIFTYTPDKMKNYFRMDNYLTCFFSLEKLDEKLFINVELRFNSKDIQKSYGKINKEDFMRIDFISGQQLFMKAVEVEDPFIESYTGNTIYKVKYAFMDGANEDYFRKYFLDKIGILWSSGYESYSVYKVDYLKEKMSCLDNVK